MTGSCSRASRSTPMTERACKQCGRPISLQRVRQGHGRLCLRCYNAAPTSIARRTRYQERQRQTAAWRAREAAWKQAWRQTAKGQREIRAYSRHWGTAQTPEQARAIEAHIRRRVCAFKQGQQDREKAESTAAG